MTGAVCKVFSVPVDQLTLDEQVKLEALAAGRRMECARQLSGTVKGPGKDAYRFGDKIRAIADELDREDAQERKRAAMARMKTPSELIAEMQRSWPAQNRAVREFAEREDLQLGEAWARVINAGVKALRNGRA